jgi:beta-glucanase (GH16 family)
LGLTWQPQRWELGLSGRLTASRRQFPYLPRLRAKGTASSLRTTTLDFTTWRDRQGWEDPPQSGAQSIVNGTELGLRRTRTGNNYQNTSLSIEPYGQANPKSFTSGYFEAKMRHEPVHGNGPAFWMLSTPPRHQPGLAEHQPALRAGRPVPEGRVSFRRDRHTGGFGRIFYGGTRTDDFYNAAVHRNSSSPYGEPTAARLLQHGTGQEFEEWHVYSALWAEVRFYLDGEFRGTVAAFDSTNQPIAPAAHQLEDAVGERDHAERQHGERAGRVRGLGARLAAVIGWSTAFRRRSHSATPLDVTRR